MDRLQSTVGGTAFAAVGEDQLLSDIRAVCETWSGDAESLQDIAARVSLARAEGLGVSESEAGVASYSGFLEAAAEQRCLRDPTA